MFIRVGMYLRIFLRFLGLRGVGDGGLIILKVYWMLYKEGMIYIAIIILEIASYPSQMFSSPHPIIDY